MRTLITNEIIITEPTDIVKKRCEADLIIPNPEYGHLMRMGKERLIKWKHVPENIYLYYYSRGELHLPFGLLYRFWDEIRKYPFETKFNDAGDISFKDETPTHPMTGDYAYQEVAVQQMIEAKGGILVGGCGSGKTFEGIEIIRRIGKKALWLCHTGDLLRQARNDFLKQYPMAKIGLTTEGKLDIGEDVTISTVQTMSMIEPELYKDKFDVIVCDESVHCCSGAVRYTMFTKVIGNIAARYKFGLTATPTRADGTSGLIRSMYAYLGTDRDGNFSETYHVPETAVKTMPSEHVRIDISSGYDQDIDFMQRIYDTSGMLANYNVLINELCENTARTDKIIKQVAQCYKEGRKQCVLSLRVKHCEYIAERLNALGIKTMLVVGKVTPKRRDMILTQQEEWDVIVATYSLLKEGISIDELDTIHLTGPAKEKGLIVQCAGRVERYMDGKKQPLVYDYVDTDIPYCVRAYDLRRRALKTRFKNFTIRKGDKK